VTTSRRTFLAGAAGGVLAGTIPAANAATPAPLPSPAGSGIDHIVVVMMENRSFDHYLGWLPGAAGKQTGLSYTDRFGARQSTHHLQGTQGCGHPDPDHSFEGGRIEYNQGACDGWLRVGENDPSPSVTTYRRISLSIGAPRRRTVLDGVRSLFSAIMAETYPNRFYQHAAAPR
jgi:phospholipase C